ncbi:uncharacterized protein A1O5_13109 [Cladophialophora psammophila CBS 110553]|uniref:Uncharacterized protein n=1 Tax=Cladophialophora psammophila CBS 110553 TaxID=1182543 RepID=W9VDH0_9EURO|nr:uncharacterized protein A1O5_13109 [Cladophialophora psammophila CBS 110553]EXJ53657.1 hypothetical protein A1O5_13109 [Cladophialophora psammophila CBS 110553]
MGGSKPLKESALKSNPTALGDPVSLKAEKSETSPVQEDKGASNPCRRPNKTLKERAEQDLSEAKKGNRSMLGDPVSLKAEKTESDPASDSEENEDGTGRSTSGGRKARDRDSKL